VRGLDSIKNKKYSTHYIRIRHPSSIQLNSDFACEISHPAISRRSIKEKQKLSPRRTQKRQINLLVLFIIRVFCGLFFDLHCNLKPYYITACREKPAINN